MEIALLTILCVLNLIQIGISASIINFGLKLGNHLKKEAANMDLLRENAINVLDNRGLVDIVRNWSEQEWG
jgi:hypothetical protein